MTATNNDQREHLDRLLASVRRRWRVRVALGGLAIALAAALGVVVLASVALEQTQYAERAVTAARAVAWLALLALLGWWVAVPLARRVSPRQVALYLEEREPSLDAALVSAVEHVHGQPVGATSPVLTQRLVSTAVERADRAVRARDPERVPTQRAGGALAGVVVAGALLLAFGPAALRNGARVLFVPWSTAEAAAPSIAVLVEPGNAQLAKGGDQEISAALRGFAAGEAELAVRRGAAGSWERIPMGAGSDSGRFVARLFDLDEETQYYVESGGVRSPVFTLSVVNLPAVKGLELRYRYPAYTGLAPQVVADGGDIAAPAGTVVRVRVTSTMPVQAGRIVVEGMPPVALARDSGGTLAGELRVTAAGFYHVELQAADGSMVRGSLDYAIDVLDDNAPTVTFKSPGRDLSVTALEEVFAEATADDDYGVSSLELVYQVNGGPEQVVPLHRGAPRREVSGGHTFYLEEQSLEPGDVVSYFARARDGTAHVSATDIYFMEVKPFSKEYRQAEQGGQPQQGGEGAEESPAALSRRQREIVAATFKIVRDSARLSASERRDNLSTVALSQGQLRERVETLARRLSTRGVLGADSAMRTVADELPKAAAAMREAEEQLGRRAPAPALPPEQRALQHLQRAEAAFREVQVAFQQQQQQGGGGGEQPDAEDLADLFELDVDRLRNQYESVQRGGRSEANDRKVDETQERLRQLAQRQQQEAERAQRRAQAMQQSGGGASGGSQRQLAEETAEAARQLERLARERQSQELAESARRLQDAANAMKRAASNATSGNAGSAEAAQALDRLQEARRLMDRERGGRLERDAREAQRAADELARRQREAAADVEKLQRQGGAGRDPQAAAELAQRKEQLARDVEALEGQLDRLSRDARRDHRDAARKLQEAAGAIREKRVTDKLRYSRNAMRGASPDYVRALEEQIATDLDETRGRVADAVGSIGKDGGQRGEQALDKARELARGLESLRERAAQGQGQGQPGQERPGQERPGQGQPGEERPGQAGQARQAGQAGQAGQQGQQGQQGQAGQAGQAGQTGQMGGQGQGAAFGGRAQPLTEEQVRQWAREYRERRQDAEGLRRALQGTGVETGQLDEVIRGLRALEGTAPYRNAEDLARLQAQVTEGFKAFEFTLRRQLAADESGRPVLGNAGEVAPKYRALVEEYYRSIGKGRQ